MVSRLGLPASRNVVPSGLCPFCEVPYDVALGVGSDDEHALSAMRCADTARAKHVPLRIVPARGQVSENVSKPSRSERWNVFHEDDSWS
jgi:hypothetical protein